MGRLNRRVFNQMSYSSEILVLIGIFLAFTVTVSTGRALGASLEEIKKRGYMIVATEDDYPPFEFVKDGKPTGLDHELVTLLKKWAPFEIRQEILPWQGLLAGVATGKYDVAITAAIITDERCKTLTFTMPVAEGTHYYVYRAGDKRIKGIKDLSGLTVGVQQGSALAAALPELDEMLKQTGGHLGKVVQYASYPEIYEEVANGRLDYAINTVTTIAPLVREKSKVFAMGQAVSKRSYHAWAVKRGNNELRDYLNQFLTDQRKNGMLYQLQEKWLGKAFPDLPSVGKLPGDRPMPE